MTASRDKPTDLVVGGERIAPGERRRFDLPIALLPTHTQLHLPLTVLHGLRPGPRVWISAAVHGDELNGVEIIRRVLDGISGPLRRGSILAVPIVNVFGFLQQSRYLPDRRDLNRSFPGSTTGSLAARMANLFLNEIVIGSTHGIDLHTASAEKVNFPQIRGNLEDPECRRLAEAFRAPVMVHSAVRDGSLRAAAMNRGIPVIVFEGGEPLRFNADAIEVGVRGVRSVLGILGLIPKPTRKRSRPSLVVTTSSWIRSRRGGLLRLTVKSGEFVEKGSRVAIVSDPFGEDPRTMRAPFSGVVIGMTNNPVVHIGDAVLHLGACDRDPSTGTDDESEAPPR